MILLAIIYGVSCAVWFSAAATVLRDEAPAASRRRAVVGYSILAVFAAVWPFDWLYSATVRRFREHV